MPEEQADESQNLPVEPPPPLLVKITGYRLLTVSLILAFGVYKSVSVPGTIFDVYNTRLGDGHTYSHCSVDPPIWPTFFHRDLSCPVFSAMQTVYIGGVDFSSTLHSGSIAISFRPLPSPKQWSQHESLSSRNGFGSSAFPNAHKVKAPISNAGFGSRYSYRDLGPDSGYSPTRCASGTVNCNRDQCRNRDKGQWFRTLDCPISSLPESGSLPGA